jgi:hypothetical protein
VSVPLSERLGRYEQLEQHDRETLGRLFWYLLAGGHARTDEGEGTLYVDGVAMRVSERELNLIAAALHDADGVTS